MRPFLPGAGSVNFNKVTYYIILILGAVLSQKEGDEGRPYEFGFTIDGQQHRHEKKDQNGIVQGEFGFITADGVYHVTVYATDENGNFKILSMRNIRISAPLDGSPATGPISPDAGKYLKSAEKQLGHKLPSPQPPSPQKELFQQHSQQLHDKPQALEIRTRKPDFFMFTTLPTIKPACAGCGYVTTEALAPGQKFQFHSSVLPHKVTGNQHSPQAGVQNDVELKLTPDNVPNRYVSKVEIHSPNIEPRINFVNNNAQNPEDTISQNLQQNSQYNQNSQNKQKMQYSQNINTENESFGMNIVPSGVNQQNIGEYPTIQEQPNFGARDYPTADVSSFGLNKHKFGNSFNQQQSQQYNYQGQHLSGVQGIKSTDANSLSDGAIGPNPLIKSKDEVSQIPPVTVSDHVIHVGGNNPMDIPIKDKYAGMVDGLPDGIEENDIKGILYKFHYTVGFHGHYEKGLSNGAKVGGYFVNGRDGISRVVTYVADENGYRPKFKFINLGLDSSDTPKAETEKNFGLKNFEFKWYPIR